MDAPGIKVLSVEDNALVSDVLARRLEGDSRFVYLGSVTTQAELEHLVMGGGPMVVCLDLNIPGQRTCEMIRWLVKGAPDARVLILSGTTDLDEVQAALNAGAWGFVSKADNISDIVEGVIKVSQGEFWFGPEARRMCASRPMTAQPTPAVETRVHRGLLSRILGR